MTFIGVDLGTSAVKAVLVDDEQAVLAEASAPLRSDSPHPGWSEQRPQDWWSAFEQAVAALRVAQPDGFRTVRGLGLAGQMHGAVALDRAGEPIRPAILWNDGRSVRECESLQAAVPELATISGIIAMPGFTAPKILWLKEREPQNFRRIWKIVSPKDYLRLRLTGDAITDMSDAAGTLWLDQEKRDWSERILAATGVAPSRMPSLVEGSDAGGVVRRELLSSLGINGPVVVAGGAGDAAAAAIGIGAVAGGDPFVSFGTSAQLFVTDARYRPEPGTLLHAFAHALPGRWFRMAAMLNGASCLDWLARVLGEHDIGVLLDRTEAAFRGPSNLLFLPYLSGERTPHNDPAARGVFAGLDAATGAHDLVQATLEGVAFSILEAIRLMERAGGRLTSLAAVGGGARSRFWMQLLAHVTGVPITRYAGGEKGPAFGAARLAVMALTSRPPHEVCLRPPVLDVLEPDAALTAVYRPRFDAWRRLYRALRPEFQVNAAALPRPIDSASAMV